MLWQFTSALWKHSELPSIPVNDRFVCCDGAAYMAAHGSGCEKTPNTVESGGTPTLPHMEIVAYNAFCEVDFPDPISARRFFTASATSDPGCVKSRIILFGLGQHYTEQ